MFFWESNPGFVHLASISGKTAKVADRKFVTKFVPSLVSQSFLCRLLRNMNVGRLLFDGQVQHERAKMQLNSWRVSEERAIFIGWNRGCVVGLLLWLNKLGKS